MGNVLYVPKADLFCYLMTLAIEKHFEIYPTFFLLHFLPFCPLVNGES